MSPIRSSGLIFILALAVFGALPAAAGHPMQSETADGVRVYLGIMPATMLREHGEEYREHNAQCPPPGGSDSHHVMIALFDESSGERITDADVEVRVSPLGLVGPRKHLHPIPVADATSYCNYFSLSTPDTYTINVDIRRPNAPGVIRTKFVYRLYRECCQ